MSKVVILGLAVLLASAPARADEKPSAAETARAFVEGASRGDFDRAAEYLDPAARKELPPDKLGEFWKDLKGQVGVLKKVLGTRAEKKGDHEIVYVACEFEKRKLDVRVALSRGLKVVQLSFVPPKVDHAFEPPPYARREAFEEKEVTVGEGEWNLPGTLSLPRGDGPYPAVVLLHGSGPHDRDETLGPNKPLRDLAWGLASQGVAALRFEKRTHAHPGRMVKLNDSVTIKEEVVDDALAAVSVLRKTAKVDPKEVYVVGHSLGAVVAPRVAELDPAVAGVVLLAGNQRPLEDLILEQVTYLFSLRGELTEGQRKSLEKLKEQVAKVKGRDLSPKTPAKELPFGQPAAYWLALRAYDQAATAARLKQPVLVLQGERDYQVTMADFEGWRKALAKKKNARLKSYPELNHLFMPGKGKGKPEEYERAGHVDRRVIDDVAGWIKGL